MPYKNRKDLYEAQKKYRKRQKAKLDQIKKELAKPQPNIPRIRELLGVELRQTAASMVFGEPQPKKKKKRKKSEIPFY